MGLISRVSSRTYRLIKAIVVSNKMTDNVKELYPEVRKKIIHTLETIPHQNVSKSQFRTEFARVNNGEILKRPAGLTVEGFWEFLTALDIDDLKVVTDERIMIYEKDPGPLFIRRNIDNFLYRKDRPITRSDDEELLSEENSTPVVEAYEPIKISAMTDVLAEPYKSLVD